MRHLVLFHGMDATSEDQWLPYIKGEMEAKGWRVDAPNIPDSANPDLEGWIKYINEQVEFTSESVLIGHSAGCPLIISLLERSNVPIKKAILVAGFIEDIGHAVAPLIQQSYDWGKIKGNAKQFYFVNSDNDPYNCNDKQGRLMLDHVGGTQIIMAGEGHFGTSEFDQDYPEFPFLIKLIED